MKIFLIPLYPAIKCGILYCHDKIKGYVLLATVIGKLQIHKRQHTTDFLKRLSLIDDIPKICFGNFNILTVIYVNQSNSLPKYLSF